MFDVRHFEMSTEVEQLANDGRTVPFGSYTKTCVAFAAWNVDNAAKGQHIIYDLVESLANGEANRRISMNLVVGILLPKYLLPSFVTRRTFIGVKKPAQIGSASIIPGRSLPERNV